MSRVILNPGSNRLVMGWARRFRRLLAILVASIMVVFPILPPPVQATGLAAPTNEPVLLVLDSNSPNPFGPYLGEILRAEGLNAFQTDQLGNLTSGELASFPIVILSQTTLSASQASLFSSYVAAGGTLVAMRPDPQLAPVFGLVPAAGTTPDGFLLPSSTNPLSAGITNLTLQYHGTADHYTLGSASVVATLYSDETTPTPFPAVVTNSFGQGQSAAFTFDLAQAVALLRQGNPATAGTDVDGDDGVPRSIEAFENGWVALDRLAVPQADELQRLFANILVSLSQPSVPLPRLWYFPTAATQSVMLVTSDDHGQLTSTFQTMVTAAESYGGRLTFYLARYGFLSAAAEQTWWTNGHELGLHPYGLADNQSLTTGFAQALQWFTGQGYVGPSNTVRIHQLEWQGWADAAKIEAANGITLDTSFYLWGAWLKQNNGQYVCTGYVNGSGLPMPFVDQSGQIIPVLQQATQLVDEQMLTGAGAGYCGMSPSQALAASTALVDQALAGDYSAITVQAHTDYWSSTAPWATGLMAYAQAKGVPMWTASRWQAFSQARHDAQLTGVAWNPAAHQLSFGVTAAPAEPTTTVLVPGTVGARPLLGATLDGAAVGVTPLLIKGLAYGAIAVPAGSHALAVTYNPNATSTATATLTATATQTPSATSTAAPTASPAPAPSTVLFRDGFEEGSFGAGGWTLNVGGTGATAQQVSAPVVSGAQAGSFSTQSQQNGEHAFAQAFFSWPSSQVVEARALIQPQLSTVQYTTKVLTLEDQGPFSWATRAGFGLIGQDFAVGLTNTNGAGGWVDTGVAYQNNQWYELALIVDLRSATPVFTYLVNGVAIYQYVDTLGGADLDHPVRLDVGLGAGNWGATAGSVVADDVAIWDGSGVPTLGPSATSTATPLATSTPTPTPSATLTPTPCGGCTATVTNTPQPTAETLLTATPTATASSTLSPTLTATPAPSFTGTPPSTATSTVTQTATATVTLVPTVSLTATETATTTATATATATSTTTATATPALAPTITGTATSEPSATSTSTPTTSATGTISPTMTAAATDSPTLTPTPTGTVTLTNVPSNTPTATVTSTPTDIPSSTPTFTMTPTATGTSTPTDIPSNTPTATATSTPTDVPSNTPTATATSTPTDVPSNTPTATATSTPTDIPSATPTLTITPTATSTDTPTNVPSDTPTRTPTVTLTPSLTSTATITNTPKPTRTPLPTKTPLPTRTPLPTKTPPPTKTPLPTKTPTATMTSIVRTRGQVENQPNGDTATSQPGPSVDALNAEISAWIDADLGLTPAGPDSQTNLAPENSGTGDQPGW